MREFIELGAVPWRETPAQVGDPQYRTNAIRECQTFIQAIRNYLGHEPDGAELAYKGFPCDLGTSYEVICNYDPENSEAISFARRCEREAPATWADGGVRPPPRAGGEFRQRRGR
jgi:hypothetical protein